MDFQLNVRRGASRGDDEPWVNETGGTQLSPLPPQVRAQPFLPEALLRLFDSCPKQLVGSFDNLRLGALFSSEMPGGGSIPTLTRVA